MDQHGPTHGAEPRCNFVAVLAAGAIIEHYFGAERAGFRELHLRGVAGHDNGCCYPQTPCRPGDALRMVAAGDADHAAPALFF